VSQRISALHLPLARVERDAIQRAACSPVPAAA
jgi:hypothetical protein